METKNLLGRNIVYRRLSGTGYGKVVKVLSEDQVVVLLKDERVKAKVNSYDIIKVYNK